MSNLKDEIITDFDKPSKLPQSEERAEIWQKKNYSWWQKNPMRYDWKSSVPAEEFSAEFFKEIDKRFFLNASEYLNDHGKKPFDELAHYSELKKKDILEIGMGNGSHAALLASSAKTFTGIDLTDYSIKSVSERFKKFGLKGNLKKMDAEKMEFPDNSFDFVWSWGVIHHSSNTENILKEIWRVLRPGGGCVIMVYHRGWWNYYVVELLSGLIDGNIFKTKSLVKSVQMHTDGALARYYSLHEWKKLVGKYFKVEKVEVMGPKTDILPLPGSKIKSFLMSLVPNALNRFLTRNMKMGVFLISTAFRT